MNPKAALAVVACAFVATATISAHHSLNAQYDFKKPLDFEGVVVKTEFINPHSFIHIERTNADGTRQVWVLASTGVGTLRRLGLLRSGAEGGLKVGQTVTISGYAARDGTSMGFLKSMKMADGRVIVTWFGDPNG
jgi:hypothetical protein